ncbi:hypothetical protein RUM43_004214 [Polyplax serrata]|uniref:Plasminogen receptor (KT) n=1 Tax=Polyplax serrata TaxID=468196 RepID=A0AAN8SBA5_POLSC
MGNIFGSRSMADTFKKNQEFIAEMNKIKTERHIQMQFQMREREAALRIARDRELVLWLGAFYLVSVPTLFIAWRRTGNSSLLVPFIPFSFILAYQMDKAYGNKLDRIRQEAEMIMQFEPEMLEFPCGLPSASSIDQARIEAEEKKKLHPAIPAL